MPKLPAPKKMSTPGHYRPPTVKVPGGSWYNAPTRGRKNKVMPSPKKPKQP